MSLYIKIKTSFTAVLIIFTLKVSAQPFRYISGLDSQIDSIKLLGIKGYKEYSSSHEDSARKMLTAIVEYDTNGNMTRNFRHDLVGGWENQYIWKYDKNNRLIEQATYSPDSMTLLQQFYHCYDERGNETEYITENYSNGVFVGNSRTLNEYDSLNHLISLKVYAKNGLHTHYEYRYNQHGLKIEELVYSPEGKLLWRRPSSELYYEDQRMPYGFPPDPDPELEALMKVTVTFDPTTGNTTYSDGYGKRIFNSKGLLIYWHEGHFRHHWYEYSFY